MKKRIVVGIVLILLTLSIVNFASAGFFDWFKPRISGNAFLEPNPITTIQAQYYKDSTFVANGDNYDNKKTAANYFRNANQMSISAWVKPEDGGDTNVFLAQHQKGRGYLMALSPGGDFSFKIKTSGGGAQWYECNPSEEASVNLKENDFNHLAMVWSDGRDFLLGYINGILVCSNFNVPGPLSNDYVDISTSVNHLYIGGSFYGEPLNAKYFKGEIKDVRLYKTALAALNVYSIYLGMGTDPIEDKDIPCGTSGDLDGSGKIDETDVSTLYYNYLDGADDSIYDVDGDGSVTEADAFELRDYVMGDKETLGVCGGGEEEFVLTCEKIDFNCDGLTNAKDTDLLSDIFTQTFNFELDFTQEYIDSIQCSKLKNYLQKVYDKNYDSELGFSSIDLNNDVNPVINYYSENCVATPIPSSSIDGIYNIWSSAYIRFNDLEGNEERKNEWALSWNLGEAQDVEILENGNGGYALSKSTGNVLEFGSAPDIPVSPDWQNGVAKKIKIAYKDDGGVKGVYVLAGSGTILLAKPNGDVVNGWSNMYYNANFNSIKAFDVLEDRSGGYVLDINGYLHKFGTATTLDSSSLQWGDNVIDMEIAYNTDGSFKGVYLMHKDGSTAIVTSSGVDQNSPKTTGPFNSPDWWSADASTRYMKDFVLTEDGLGAYVLDSQGNLYNAGNAPEIVKGTNFNQNSFKIQISYGEEVIPFGCSVTLYADSEYRGDTRTYTQDTNFVGWDFNDKTSSLKIRPLCTTDADCSENQECNDEGVCIDVQPIIPGQMCAHPGKAGFGVRPGVRLKQGAQLRFCDPETLQLANVKANNADCQNDYECRSNVCIDGKCVSIGDVLRDQASLLQRIWCFITNPLSSEDYDECLAEFGDNDDSTTLSPIAQYYVNEGQVFVADGVAEKRGFPNDVNKLKGATEMSLSVDVKPETGGQTRIFIGQHLSGRGYYLSLSPAGTFEAGIKTSVGKQNWYQCASDPTVDIEMNANDFNHVVMTWSDSKLRGYVNGIQFCEVQNAPGPLSSEHINTATSTNHMYLGGSFREDLTGDKAKYFKGEIKDIRLYDKALTLEEINSIA